jgi:hypothetical protein
LYPTDEIEKLTGLDIGDKKPEQYHPARPYEEYFAEGGRSSIRHTGKGSRIREKMVAEERKRLGFE